MSYTHPARATRGRPRRTAYRVYRVRRRRALLVVAGAVLCAQPLLGSAGHTAAPGISTRGHAAAPGVSAPRSANNHAQGDLAAIRWPRQGQAALALGNDPPATSPGQQPVAIASVAKVMTAYLVLKRYPLSGAEDGFTITITPAQAQREAEDLAEGQSVAAVRAGEQLTERQLLEALLIPSGNNIAQLLADQVAGSETSFVADMNGEARSLGMDQTTYTDPSGWDPGTVSTAGDQLRLLRRAMRDPAFRQITSLPSVTLPVAGTLTNFNPLVRQGYAGKTGSDSAAGGCLAFFTTVTVADHQETAAGVVLGQGQGNNTTALLAAAGRAAAQLVASATSAPPHQLASGPQPLQESP